MRDELTSAIEMHRAGHLAPAAQLYQKVLADETDDADALHLLGVVRHQQGDHARAVELIGRAVALCPNVPGFHANLAEAYRALGQLDRAVGCCRMALRLLPDYPEALCNLGLALQGQGKHADAAEQFRRALKVRPEFASAHSNLGISLRALGDLESALGHFRRAAELDPKSATARTNLGQMLVDSALAEEALPHCEEAVRLQPDSAPMRHNLGNALRALGKLADARAAYLEALRLDPNLAQAHAHLGLVLQQEGQFADALVWLKQATELKPDDAQVWEYLAELHGEREEQGEAIPCWQRVLALAPERASAHHGIGWALQDEGRPAEAEEHYHAALRIKPDFAGARMALGGLHEEQGDLAEAEAAFRDALRFQPNFALPHARLATLLRGKLPETDRAALENRLADPELDPGPRARLLFALAHVVDARGDYAKAAAYLREANALSVAQQHGERRYVPAEHERFVDGVMETFDARFFARTAGSGLMTDRPVFVFGLPRSGTTLIEQIIASHPRACGAGELRLGRQALEGLPALLGRADRPLECVAHLDAAGLRRLAERYIEGAQRHVEVGTNRFVDKMPDNYIYLGLLAAMFPRAVFIHCRRDPRDVAVSCWMTDFRSIRWANDPEHIASRFGQYRRLMDHWRSVLPVPVHEVVYEQIVEDFEPEARRLVRLCGLAWDAACARFHETARPVRTASVTQVREPLYRRSLARWKHYEAELGDLFARLPDVDAAGRQSEASAREPR